uniref:RRM domain-containing protein n=1 Tax=Glossina brevipalpis TaxID=37001 RepID=A0A1A9VZK1_9MUSC
MAEVNEKNSIIRNPNFSKSRLYINNLPICTSEELEKIFLPFGKVFGTLLRKRFGFVQMKSEEIATRAAAALTNTTFKGNIITVRKAGDYEKSAPNDSNNSGSASNPCRSQQEKATRMKPIGNFNHCEIIVVELRNLTYGKMIERRLQLLGLEVDILLPNPNVSLKKVISTMAAKGCIYAILINNLHEKHRSITLYLLQGQLFEHRNMPLDDAIKLIDIDFRTSHRGVLAGNVSKKRLIQSAAIRPVATSSLVVPFTKERHPAAIQTLLTLLARNSPLTVLQYDCIIKYLQEQRALQMKAELEDVAEKAASNVPDPEIALQKKIIQILNKPSVAEIQHNLLYPTLEAAKQDARLIGLLRDVRIQKALDSMMDTDLSSKVEKLMNF